MGTKTALQILVEEFLVPEMGDFGGTFSRELGIFNSEPLEAGSLKESLVKDFYSLSEKAGLEFEVAKNLYQQLRDWDEKLEEIGNDIAGFNPLFRAPGFSQMQKDVQSTCINEDVRACLEARDLDRLEEVLDLLESRKAGWNDLFGQEIAQAISISVVTDFMGCKLVLAVRKLLCDRLLEPILKEQR